MTENNRNRTQRRKQRNLETENVLLSVWFPCMMNLRTVTGCFLDICCPGRGRSNSGDDAAYCRGGSRSVSWQSSWTDLYLPEAMM